MLKYLHKGFIPGVPARDLTDDEAHIYGKKRLIASGLYQEVRERKSKKNNEVPEQQAEE